MLSVVIATQDSERALLQTLAALVAGAVAGMVREVIVADAGSHDGTAVIADVAGCRLLASAAGRGARLKAAADAACAPWLLFLEPGAVPDPSWIDETRRFIGDTELARRTQAAMFRAAATRLRPLPTQALAWLRAALGTAPDASRGLLIARSHYEALGGHRDVAHAERDLILRVGRRRIIRLRTAVTTMVQV